MELDEDRLTALKQLLREASAHLVDSSGKKGTGFFIDEGLLLTCAHVVPDENEVDVTPYRRTPRTGRVVTALPGKSEDLALIEVPGVAGEPPQPAVVLDRTIKDNIKYYGVGYPRDELTQKVGTETTPYQGRARYGNNGEVQLLQLDAGGARVGGGLSGGAMLSSESGAVVAIVQYSQDPQTDSGGGCIPVARAGELLEPVGRVLQEPPVAGRSWRDTLGEEAWQGLGVGKHWSWTRSITVTLSGNRAKWNVSVDPHDEPPLEITVGQLEEGDIAEAVFEWIQRGRVRKAEQVLRLGQLLAGALLPTSAMERIVHDRLADELTVRLEVDRKSELFDVPWEFVTVASDDGPTHLAAEQGVQLVRVAPHGGVGQLTTEPVATPARVLVVVQPAEPQEDMPVNWRERRLEWPTWEDTDERLAPALDSPRIELISPLAPTMFDIEEHLKGQSPDVLHYVGYGHMKRGVPSIALSDGVEAQFRDVKELFDLAGAHGVRVLVLQFLRPHSGADYEPVPPRTFVSALDGTVNAVVFTQQPVHPRQLYGFNQNLYRRLAAGMTVEAAVQEGRRYLLKNAPVADPAGFGWFTLLTGPQTGTRICSAPTPASATLPKQNAQEAQVPVGAEQLPTFGPS
ncbi:MAG: serine protease [Actinomycetota bacterium]|nr:serine protease [Actinomycetota bacterium]